MYVSSLKGSTLLRLGNGRMRSQNPRRYGLPDASDAAAWVDADGDGRLDLHSVPGGLYRGHGAGFRQTGKLAGGGRYAHLSWADFDNNGLREPVLARTDGEFTIDSRGWWYGPHPLTRRPHRPWLEVAVPGNWLTSRIVVKPNRGKRRIGWAGEAETSRFSQGHNRVYFTLPRGARRADVSVRTADGTLHRVRVKRNHVVDFGVEPPPRADRGRPGRGAAQPGLAVTRSGSASRLRRCGIARPETARSSELTVSAAAKTITAMAPR